MKASTHHGVAQESEAEEPWRGRLNQWPLRNGRLRLIADLHRASGSVRDALHAACSSKSSHDEEREHKRCDHVREEPVLEARKVKALERRFEHREAEVDRNGKVRDHLTQLVWQLDAVYAVSLSQSDRS